MISASVPTIRDRKQRSRNLKALWDAKKSAVRYGRRIELADVPRAHEHRDAGTYYELNLEPLLQMALTMLT